MSKRPLCQVTVFLVLLLVLLQQFLPEVFRQENIPAENKETVTICGRIYDRQEKNDKTCFYLKEVIFKKSDEISQNFQGNCIVYCSSRQFYSIGSYIQLTGTISFFEEGTNPGQFNAKAYYKGQGIDFAVLQAEIKSTNHQKDYIKEALYSLRMKIHNKLEQLAGEQAPVLQAMLLGEKSQMDSEIKELYQRSGISHILTISGLHFSLLGMSLYKLLRKLGASFRISGILSMTVLLLYGIMTGFGVSAIRAFIMFVMLVGADICGRSYDFPTSLSVAVLYLVLDNPYVLYQTGFLLSVGAILGLILIMPAVTELYPVRYDKGLKKTLSLGIRSGASIQLMTFPILLYSFYEFSPYSVLLNCLIVPLVPVVVLGAVAAVIVSFLSVLPAQILLMPSLWVLKLYEFLCKAVGKLPGAGLVTGQPPVWRMVVYYIGLFLIISGVWLLRRPDREKEKASVTDKKRISILYKWQNSRITRLVITGSTALLMVFLATSKDRDGVEISMLDVGQGQSIYIRCGSDDILYDGGSSDVSEVGKYRIVPFLKARGAGCLELVIVSHMDADHYNGIFQMLEEDLIDVKCLMVPQLNEPDETYIELVKLAEEKGVKVTKVEKNDCFFADDAKFQVLHPYEGYQADSKNDTSLVISMVYDDFSMLLTGDVEAKGEEDMIQSEILPDVDLLQVAHHGSGSSSTQAFLDRITPRMAWISCGKDNNPTTKLIQAWM